MKAEDLTTGKGLDDGNKESLVDESELPPVEGLRAWIVVLGSFCMHFVAVGTLYAFGIYVVPYEDEFQIGRAQGSIPYIIATFFMFGGGAITGRLGDMFGVKVVYGAGSVIWAVAYLLASLSTQYWMIILLQGGLAGIGMSLLFWPTVTVVAQWFEERRALALGIANFGAGIGNLVFGVATERLIDAYDFRFALRIVAASGFAILLFGFFCIKRRLPLEKKGGLSGDTSILKENNFRFIGLSAFFFQFGFHAPLVFLASFAIDNGITSQDAGVAVGLIGVGSAIGRILLGAFADKLGRLDVFRLVLFLTSITLYLWPLCTIFPTLAAFAVAFGFFSGGKCKLCFKEHQSLLLKGFIALIPAVLAEYYGVKRLGGIMGLVSLATIPGSLGGPPLVGLLYDVSGDYLVGIMISATFILFSSFSLLFIMRPEKYKAMIEAMENKL